MRFTRKTFSITDKLVQQRLEEVDNQSQYIQMLIRRDIMDSNSKKEFQSGIEFTLNTLEIAIDGIRKAIKNK